MSKIRISIKSKNGTQTEVLSNSDKPVTVLAQAQASYQITDAKGGLLAQVKFGRKDADLLVQDPDTGEQITIEGYYDHCASSNCLWHEPEAAADAVGNWISSQSGFPAPEQLASGQMALYQWSSSAANSTVLSPIPLSNWTFPALGALGLMAAASGGGGGSEGPSAFTVSGQVDMGPLLNGHGVVVDIYRDGVLLKSGIVVAEDGSYSYAVEDGKRGAMLARARDTDSDADYLSEAGEPRSLTANLRAAANAADGVNLTLNINPLTELAMRKMVGANDNTIANGVNPSAINKAMAALWGLGDIDLTQAAPKLIIDSQGRPTSDADAYGKILALLAGLDEVKGSLNNSLDAISANIVNNAGLLSWANPQLIADLYAAALRVGLDPAQVIPPALKATDQTAPVITGVTAVGLDAAGQSKSATLAAGDKIQLAIEFDEAVIVTGTPSLTLVFAGQSTSANYLSGSGSKTLVFAYTLQEGLQTSALQVGSALVLGTGASIKDLAGNPMVNTLPALSQNSPVQIDAIRPATPVLGLVQDTGNATDAYTNNGAVAIGGLESNATWQYSTDGGNLWINGTGTSLTLTGDGVKTIVVRQRDSAGNVSATSAPLTFTLDTLPPGPVSIDPVGGNDVVTLLHKLNGLTLSGTADAGATVHVTWGGLAWTPTANQNGHWNITLTAEQVRSIGSAATVTASVSDQANNLSPTASRTVGVTESPLIATIHAQSDTTATDDGYINAAELAAGVDIVGYAMPGSYVLVFLSGRAGIQKAATADATTGQWRVSFANYELPQTSASAPLVATVLAQDANNRVGAKGQIIDTGISNMSASVESLAFGSEQVINQAVVASDGGVVVSGTTEAGARITLYWDSAANSAINSVPIVADASAGTWSYTIPVAGLPANGHRVLVYRITDIAGNQADYGSSSLVVANSAPPAPSINDYSNGAPANIVNLSAKNAATTSGITFSGTASNASSVDVNWANIPADQIVLSNGVWTATFHSVPTDAAATTLSVTSYDAYSNSTVGTKTIVVDTTVAKPTLATVGTNNTLNQAQVQANTGVLLSGSAEPFAALNITWGQYSNNQVSANAAGQWSVTLQSADIPTNGAPLQVIQTDVAGNTSEALQVNVLVDVAPPAPPVISTVQASLTDDNGTLISVNLLSVNNPYINKSTANASIEVTGTAEAGSSVSVQWGGTTKTVQLGTTQTSWSAVFSAQEIPPDTNTTGAGTSTLLRIQATDALGNTSGSSTQTILVDTSAPPLPSLAPVGATVMINGASQQVVNWASAKAGVTLQGTGTPGDKVNIQWGEDNGSLLVDIAPNGTWSTTITTAMIPGYHATAANSNINLALDDAYTVTIRQVDSVGNTSAPVSQVVTVDWSTTAVELAPVTGDGYINKAEYNAANGSNVNVALNGTADPGATVRLQWGTLDKTITADATGSWTYALNKTDIPLNAAPITLTATDVYGNTTSTTTQANTNDGNNQTPVIDLSQPAVTAVANNVANKANAQTQSLVFTVTFDQPLSPFAVNAGSFQAENGTVDDVMVVQGSNGLSYTVSVTPNANRDVGSQIFLRVVDDNLTDVAGNPVARGSLASFSVVSLDNVSPTVTAVADNVEGTVNVGHPALDVTLTFSEALVGSLGTANFIAENASVSSVTALSNNQYRLHLLPAAQVANGSIQLKLIGTGLTDAAGNAMNGTVSDPVAINWTQALDNVAPTVTGLTNNVNGKANASTTAIEFTVTFSEALSGTLGTSNFTATHAAVTEVTALGNNQYKVTVQPTQNTANGDIALSLIGSGIGDAAGNAVSSTSLASLGVVSLDNVAPAVPQLIFNNSTTYTPPGAGSSRAVDFVANSGGTYSPTDANTVSQAEYLSGFTIAGLTEVGSQIKLVWTYSENGINKSVSIDSGLTINGSNWSYFFDSSHMPQKTVASNTLPISSILSIFATDAAGNTSQTWSRAVILDYVI